MRSCMLPERSAENGIASDAALAACAVVPAAGSAPTLARSGAGVPARLAQFGSKGPANHPDDQSEQPGGAEGTGQCPPAAVVGPRRHDPPSHGNEDHQQARGAE